MKIHLLKISILLSFFIPSFSYTQINYSGEILQSNPLQTFPSLPPSGRNASSFGEEVSSLGDLNGDGFDDWALGLKHAAEYPSGEKLGKVYIYFGGSNLSNEKNPDLVLAGEKDSDRFGNSVASAGDINNDGFADVIVGAYWNSDHNYLTGKSYLFLGGEKMDNIPDLIFNGEARNDLFGYSVSSAGDVNGDSFSDILIGAYYNSAAGTNAGRAYLYFGGTNMNNIADIVFTGETIEDYFGNSVSSAGDLNNDGFSDIVIAAYLNNAKQVDAGSAYIYFGGLAMDNSPDVVLSGENFLGRFGSSVSSAGDVNKDGFDDLLVGESSSGRAYIFFGGIRMDNISDIKLKGETLYDSFGIDVSIAGDFNNDGFSDVIIGAPSGGNNIAGAAYLFLGGSSMDSIPDVIFNGEGLYDNFGIKVSLAGDINNDGFSDIISGAEWNSAAGYKAGRAYIYFGKANVTNIPDIILSGEKSYERFGRSVSSAGDVNNDGFDDILIGVDLDDSNGPDAGAAYLFFGGNVIDNIPDIIFKGEENYDGFGVSVSSSGDVNNDGYDDIVIGAHNNSSEGMAAGRAYIFLGGENMHNIPDIILTGEASFDFFGNSVASAGDVNKDGFSDIIIGAYSNEAAGYDAGSAYLFLGGTNMDNIPDKIFRGEAALDYFGNSVSSAGDLNKDGYSDIIIGAYLNDAAGSDAGKAYIYFGGEDMDTTADLILTGEVELVRFGSSVSSAGDINGDGYSDVLVGANLAGIGGKAYLFMGGENMDNIPDIIFNAEELLEAFGISVGPAGDINNDGFSDLIIGANSSSIGGYSSGKAYLFLGGPEMNNILDVIFIGEASSDFFGSSVASAGDINNDNFSDIIISAPENCAVGYKMGKAYLFSGGNIILDTDKNDNELPEDYILHQNYPNPFNPVTTIKFHINESIHVTLKIYDILGNEIITLVDEEKSAGKYSVNFDGSSFSSGVYFYRLQAGNFSDTKKLMLLK